MNAPNKAPPMTSGAVWRDHTSRDQPSNGMKRNSAIAKVGQSWPKMIAAKLAKAM